MIRHFRFIFLLAFAVVISVTSCKPGTGTLAITLEADDKAATADVKKVEDIYRQRLDKFGIDEDNILLTTTGNRIKVEISELSKYSPEIRERLRKLLQSTANLEFWETYNVAEAYPSIDAALRRPPLDSAGGDTVRLHKELFTLLQPNMDQNMFSHSCMFGMATAADTSKVNSLLDSARASGKLLPDLVFAWTTNKQSQSGNVKPYCELVLLKAKHSKAAMAHPVITKADAVESEYSGSPEISITMEKADGEIWRRLTKDNIGRCVAIVLDGTVYSYPTVQSEITGGVSSVSGNFTKQEAEDLANILGAGYLPVRMRIVEENETK